MDLNSVDILYTSLAENVYTVCCYSVMADIGPDANLTLL